MPRIETQTQRPQRPSAPPAKSKQPQVPPWAWILGIGVGGVLLLVGLESLTENDSDTVAQPPSLAEAQPAKETPGEIETPLSAPAPEVPREPLPALTEPPSAIEVVRQAHLQALRQQTAEQPTSALERSSLALTPEQIQALESSGRMVF